MILEQKCPKSLKCTNCDRENEKFQDDVAKDIDWVAGIVDERREVKTVLKYLLVFGIFVAQIIVNSLRTATVTTRNCLTKIKNLKVLQLN